MDVSENSGSPQIIQCNKVFHDKPSILGYPYFGNTHMGWQHEPPQKHHVQDQAFIGAGRWVEWIHSYRSAKPKSNVLHLKMAPGKRSFLLDSIIFSVHGSFAGGGGVGCWSISNAFEGLTLDLFSHGMKRETRGMAWCSYYMVTGSVSFLCRFDSGIFSKTLPYDFLFYCVTLQ